jgi:esterase/lipase superfamily enzyme
MQFVDPSMRREIYGWYSHRLGMDMPIVRYGHWGHPVLLFPTASGDFLEAERMFLIKVLEPLINAGKINVFAIESINRYAWMNEGLPVWAKARNQNNYSGYIEQEVVPYIRHVLQDQGARIAVTGASFGAFFAANAFFRRPDAFDTLIAMSGFYDLGDNYLQGYGDDNTYFNNPVSYLSNMNDHGQLETLRHSQIHILSGRGAYERPDCSERLSQVLWGKGVPNNLDLWGHDVNHDWPWWRSMLPHYLGERVHW